jgi:SPP1 gp7 family putative phage head morphogenesis protein
MTKPRRDTPVPQTAIDYIEAKVGRLSFSYTDVWAEEHDVIFTVAKVAMVDILIDVRESLTEAIRNGTPFREWAADVGPLLDQSGWAAYDTEKRTRPYRLEIIYQTNLRQARAVGQWERIQATKEARPNLRYALGPSERHRPQHEAWDGVTLPADDPWWDDHYPPLGFRCRCHLIQESDRQTDRRGGLSERPDDGYEELVNPRTGKTERTPRGVHPSFAYNPGKVRKQKFEALEQQARATLAKAKREAQKAVK